MEPMYIVDDVLSYVIPIIIDKACHPKAAKYRSVFV